jgi:hypothetical protein
MALPNTATQRDWTRTRPGFGPGSGVELYGPHWQDEFDRLYENDEYLEGLLDSITTDAVTLSGTQTITGAKTFSAAANFDAAADFDGAVDMSAGLTVSGGTPAFSTKIQANAGMNIASGQRVEHNGTPVAGYYDEGTPFFIKRLTGNLDGSGNATVAHGIADYTKIQQVRLRMLLSTSPAFFGHDYVAAGPSFLPDSITWNATNIVVTGGVSGGTRDYVLYVEYTL